MKSFVFLVLVLALAFPAWGDKACYDVEGMTCAACGLTVKTAIKKLGGIQDVSVSVDKKKAVVQFDPGLTNTGAIEEALDATGYDGTLRQCQTLD